MKEKIKIIKIENWKHLYKLSKQLSGYGFTRHDGWSSFDIEIDKEYYHKGLRDIDIIFIKEFIDTAPIHKKMTLHTMHGVDTYDMSGCVGDSYAESFIELERIRNNIIKIKFYTPVYCKIGDAIDQNFFDHTKNELKIVGYWGV